MENGPEVMQSEHLVSISPLRQAFSWMLCLLKGPGTLQILSSQEIWVLFDLSFYLPSFNPGFCLPEAWSRDCAG